MEAGKYISLPFLSLPFNQTVINGYFGKTKLEPIYSEAAGHPRASMMSLHLAYPMPCLSVCPSHPIAPLCASARSGPMSLAPSTPLYQTIVGVFWLLVCLPSPFAPGQDNSSVKLLVAFCFFSPAPDVCSVTHCLNNSSDNY